MAKKQDKTPGADEAVDMDELIKALGIDDAAGKDAAIGDTLAGKDATAGKDTAAGYTLDGKDAAAGDAAADKKTTAGGDAADNADAGRDDESLVSYLKACAARLATPHEFKPGQLIRWKKGLKNKQSPDYGQPVIVVEVLAAPVIDKDDEHKNAGTPYFREPLTIIAGEVDGDGDFFCFHYDARRFEPYTEPMRAGDRGRKLTAKDAKCREKK